jgi:hypothetical protein
MRTDERTRRLLAITLAAGILMIASATSLALAATGIAIALRKVDAQVTLVVDGPVASITLRQRPTPAAKRSP